MRWFLKSALALALIYSALAAWLLTTTVQNNDGAGLSDVLPIILAPWIDSGLFGQFEWLGRHYWLAIPMNALTLYLVIVLGNTIYRNGFGRR